MAKILNAFTDEEKAKLASLTPGAVSSVGAGDNLNNSGTASDPIINLNNTITSTSGALNLNGGSNGAVNLTAGDGASNGGNLTFTTGFGNNGRGGNVIFSTSEGTNANGGSYTFTAGNGASDDGSGAGGGYTFSGGNGGFVSGDGGGFAFNTGSTDGGTGSSGSFVVDIGADFGGGVGIIELNGQVKITGGSPAAGKVLTSNAIGLTTWEDAGEGDVVGPNSSTNNAIARFDLATGKLIQNSGVIIDDTDNMTGVNLLEVGQIHGNQANGLLIVKGDDGGLVGGNLILSSGAGTSTAGTTTITGGPGIGATDGGDIILNAGSSAGAMGGEVAIKGGNSLGPQVGGDVIMLGGDGGSSDSSGGNMIFAGGAGGDTNGAGGSFFLLGGGGGLAGNSDGGDVNITGGASAGSGVDGDIILSAKDVTVDLSGSMFVGPLASETSALFQVQSNTKGWLGPRMSTTQRDLISSPATGLQIYNATTDTPEYFNGLSWSSSVGDETLAETLVHGNTTDGTDLIVSSGDSLTVETIVSPSGTSGADLLIESGNGSAGNGGRLEFRSGFGAGAGGVLDILAGGGTFAGGALNIRSGEVGGSGVAGTITIEPGVSGGASDGGQVHIFGGVGGDADGDGGQILIHSGAGGNNDGNGALLSIEGGQGNANGNSDGGDVDIQGGAEFGAGVHGFVLLNRSSGKVGVGTSDPKTNFHIETNNTSSIGTVPQNRGMLITGSQARNRVYFESTDSASGSRLFSLGGESGDVLEFNSYTDDGSSMLSSSILSMKSGGLVGIGTNAPEEQLHVQGVLPTFIIEDPSDFGQSVIELRGSRNLGDGNVTVAQIQGYNSRSGAPVRTSSIMFTNGLSGDEAGGLAFQTKSQSGSITERMRIDDDGVVSIDGEIVSTVSQGVIEVYSLDDLPAPAAGVITLPSGLYIIKAPLNFGTNTIDITGNSVQIYSENSFVNSITYEGTGTFFNSTDTASLRIFYPGITMILSGDGATFVDMIGSLGIQFSSILFTHVNGGHLGTLSGKDTGALTSSRFFMIRTVVSGWLTGFNISDTSRSRAETITVESHVNASTGFINLINADGLFYIINGDVEINNVNASLIDIDPTSKSPVYLNNIDLNGSIGGYFQTGIEGTFASVFDETVALTTIDSVTDSSGIARFNFTVGPTLFVHQQVDISNFVTETNYNQTGIITVVGAGFFEVKTIDFTADDATGDFSSDSVQMFETATALVDGDTVNIDTDLGTEYDGGATVYGQDTNTFRINRVFSISTSGTWSTASLNETSPFVRSVGNLGLADSKFIGSVNVTGNTTVTVINNSNEWTDFDLGGNALESSNIERWKLIDDTTGEVEYIGVNPFSGTLSASFTASGTGGGVDYEFRMIKNGSVTSDNIISGITTTAALRNASLLAPVTAVNGDLFRLQVQNLDNTNTITIANMSTSIQ